MSGAAERTATNSGSWGHRAIGLGLKYGIYILFVVLCLAVALATPVFLTPGNIANVLSEATTIGVVAVGTTFVIIGRNIDVSVGSIVALSSAVGVSAIILNDAPWWIGLLLFFVVGAGVGVVNGFATAYLGMPSFLVTLATMTVARGLVLALSGGRSLPQLPEEFKFVGSGDVGPIPATVIIMLLTFLVGHLVLSRTLLGRYVYAVGSNPAAARVGGINVRRVILSTFVIGGICAAVGGVLLSARLNAFTASMGQGYEFSAIAAVVIGGTSLYGGKGSMGGTLIGVLIITVINNALNLMGVSVFYQDVVRGLVIFFAVLFDTVRSRYAVRYED